MFAKTHLVLVKKLLVARKVTNECGIQEARCTNFVKALSKQLKKDMFMNLLKAILEESEFTACITMSRNNWNTLVDKTDAAYVLKQLEHVPHVWVCRQWRWPEVWSPFQLSARPICACSREMSFSKICIQPYHYDKISQPYIASVQVPNFTKSVPASDLNQDSLANPRNQTSSNELISPLSKPLSGDCRFADEKNSGILTPPRDTTDAQLVKYSDPVHWCAVSYYELNQRIGETFNAIYPSVRVDGFTDPCAVDRFCLGLLSNVNRNQVIEATRRNIGKGVKISYSLGEVFVECLSESAIFVQSKSCNSISGWHPASVVKLPPGSTLKIFNNQDFAMLLSRSVNFGFESVYRLTEMCIIRMSFVKGWGAEYRRQTVTATPCWIEIRLNGPLQWLDKVLTKMGSPNIKCSSVS